MQTANVQELKELLLKTDEEFRQLATQHHNLDERLHELSGKPYLSDVEQVEEVKLKKVKLQLKDKMADILRRPPREAPQITPQKGGLALDRAAFPFTGGTVDLATAAARTVGYAGAVPLLFLAA